MDDPPPRRPEPSQADLDEFNLAVTRERLQYLRHIRACGHSVDEAEIGRLEAEIQVQEAESPEMAKKQAMITDDDLNSLQESFAWVDLLSESSGGSNIKLLLIQRDHVKLRMRPEDNHSLPHFHLEYKKLYAASYQINPLRRLAGYMPKQYEEKLSEWITKNQRNLLATWNALKAGEDVRELVVERKA